MKNEIQKIFKGDIEDSEEMLAKYSHDASIFSIRPKLVLFPKDSVDVQNLVKWVGENKTKYPEISITARCAGTDMSGGSIGESLILDFTRYMNKLVNFDVANMAITVQPGMFYRDFEKLTLEKGLILPCFTASKSINAVGGMFGNNSAGERTLKFGKTENYILETKIVFADGQEYVVKGLSEAELNQKTLRNDFEGYVYAKIFDILRKNTTEIEEARPNVHKNSAGYYLWNVMNKVPKNSAGKALAKVPDVQLVPNVPDCAYFDLNKLLVGSQGTLGIATEITFKLVPEPKHTRLLVVFLRDMSLLPSLVNKILKYNPQSLESYDDKTFLLVLKYIKSFIELLGFKNLFKLFFGFWPEAIMTLQNGFPKLILLVEFTGESQIEADLEAETAYHDLKTMKKCGVRLTRSEFEAKKYWTIRHEAFNLIRYHLKKVKSKPFIDDVIVRPEKLPEFFPALYKILDKYKKRMTFAVGGHSGDGNMHIYTLVDPKDPNLKEMIMEVSDQVYDLVARLEGSITAEHNDGLIRTPYLSKMYSPGILNLFKETKEIFDPLYILNPGKKVPAQTGEGTTEYLVSHIAVENNI